MNIKELATTLSAAHPTVPQKAIEAVLRGAFKAVRDEIAAGAGGSTVKCLPLGNFKIVDKPAKAAEGAAAAADAPKHRITLRLAADKSDAAAKPKNKEKQAARKAERMATKTKAGKA